MARPAAVVHRRRNVRQLARWICPKLSGRHAATAFEMPVHGRYGAESVSGRLSHWRHDQAAAISGHGQDLPQSARQPPAPGRVVSPSHLRRLLAAGGLHLALRQDECPLLYDRKLVRLHEPGLHLEFSRPASSRRSELPRPAAAPDRTLAACAIKQKQPRRRSDLSAERHLTPARTYAPL